ncbi:hypothetical protein [Variovorax rhizosphaerae]|uniref:Uncharacterized protein n=1 Tax=Variovorax rhizosphaerae TaxID=1836200 RepID=A0ABU8WK18_9BURK
MKIGWQLPANLIAWLAAFPLFNAGTTALGRGWEWASSGTAAATMAVLLLVWAGMIYWFLVPRGATATRRAIYLVAFVLLVLAAGVLSFWLAFWLHVGLFGL